jgi:hypothetical protein
MKTPKCEARKSPKGAKEQYNTVIWCTDIPDGELAITRRIVEYSPALYDLVVEFSSLDGCSSCRCETRDKLCAEAREVLKRIAGKDSVANEAGGDVSTTTATR